MIGLQRIIEKQNKVVITDRMWARLLSSTNQPSFMSVKDVKEDKQGEVTKDEEPETQLLDNGNCTPGAMVTKEVKLI